MGLGFTKHQLTLKLTALEELKPRDEHGLPEHLILLLHNFSIHKAYEYHVKHVLLLPLSILENDIWAPKLYDSHTSNYMT